MDRVAFETVGDVEDQPATVLGDGAVGVVPRILGDRVDERVVGLRLAERVPVDADLLLVVALAIRPFRVARVIKGARVRDPRHAGELGVRDEIWQVAAGLDLAQAPGVPVRAAVRDGIGHVAPVRADRIIGERCRRIGRQRVRVHEHLGRRIERGRPVQDALVLRARLFDVKVPAALLHRHARLVVEPAVAVLLVVPEFRQALLERFARGNRIEVRLGHGVLGRDPGREFGRRRFHPAIRIGDFSPVKQVHGRAARRGGIMQDACDRCLRRSCRTRK